MLADSILEGLNPEQREAVTTTEGPLLVLAGAGSGKTRVLVHRVAWLVGGCGIPPDGILAVTFTNKAAGEMRERVEKLLGPEAEALWCSTFHSACVRLLRREAGHLGLSRGFVIYDDDDSLQAVKEALRRHSLDPKVNDPRRLRWRIDQYKNQGMLPAAAVEAASDMDEELTSEIYASYQRILAENEALDFNDLLLRTTLLFEQHPDVLAHYRRRWQYVLIDEYQDTNRVQYKLIQQLAGEHRNLCVVGDPDQSVYGWRGADIRNILDFERDFPDATVVRLERNYRSTRSILEGASAVVSHNVERLEKRLFTEAEGGDKIRLYHALDDRDEAQFVVRGIIEEVRASGRPYRDAAIFYRTNAQSRPFEEELLKYDVPYNVIGGVRFYARAEVKDALAYLRLATNPNDAVALRRIVNNPPRGIGKATVVRAAEWADEQGAPLLDGLRAVAQGGGRSGAKVAAFLELAEQMGREVPNMLPAEAISFVLERSGYLRHLEQQNTAESEGRLENLRELLAGADDFAAANAGPGEDDRSALELFLEEVALVADIDQHDTRADRVSLMTVHSAKGLEFPLVFLVGLEEGIFPHSASSREDRGVEEERRLCYVGMTRAMQRLTLTCAEERRRFGSRSYQVASRFLSEIPPELLDGELPGTRASSSTGGDYAIDYSYAQAEAGESSGGLGPGLRVRHPIFGEGTVMQVAGAGQGQKLRIRFDRVGVKTVLLRFANLEVV